VSYFLGRGGGEASSLVRRGRGLKTARCYRAVVSRRETIPVRVDVFQDLGKDFFRKTEDNCLRREQRRLPLSKRKGRGKGEDFFPDAPSTATSPTGNLGVDSWSNIRDKRP